MIFYNDPPVITGIGVASSLGTNKTTFLYNLERGVSGLEYIEGYDVKDLPLKKAFPVKDPLRYNDDRNDPCVNFALHATHEAIDDASLELNSLQNKNIFVSISSSKGGMVTFERIKKDPTLLAGSFPALFADHAAMSVMREFALRGYACNTVTACATGVHSMIAAARGLKTEEIDLALAGASDASITPLMLAGYKRLGAYSTDDMRPFDKYRSGFIIGEGAGVTVMETESSARKRGAEIYARIRGYIMAQDIGGPTRFDPQAHVLSQALRRFLKDLDLRPRDIDYVNLHGTATVLGDLYEAEECIRAFGDEIRSIKFNAVKSMLGHMLGASGAIETIITVLSIRNNIIFPTINVTQQAPFATFDLNCNTRSHRVIQRALKISMGFGGQIGILLLEK
ncbi:MAG: beta-ketoacyl-[acyl-carrier-protein] synthase family protein [Candidatus Omnitrophica bacterium]|nr:beta-ketoacyl-[acyl-carrier-protein] synthase family protein [Candidatus Omnitrophota bacterium]